MSGMNNTAALEKIEEELPATKYREQIVKFIKKSDRGILRGWSD